MKKIEIMVTGGTGLFGKAIEKISKTEIYNKYNITLLSSKDGDLCNYEETKSIFEKIKPTHVIHLAAMVGGLFKNMKCKGDFYMKNTQINNNIVECCKLYKIEKLISCLSTCIFPDKTSYPIDETMIHNGPPHCSNEGYAYAKRMIDVLNRCYKEQYKCNFTSIIPTNIYGPYDNFNIEDGHVIPGLINKCYHAKQNNTDFVIWGSGKPLRQFIYSYDLAELTMWALFNYDSCEPLILSVGEEDEISIKELAHLIAKSIEFKGNIIFDETKSDGQYKKTANNNKLKSLTDFKFTNIEEGIKETCDWYISNYEKARK